MCVFTAYYRFVVLFFNCMLTFGSYFCFDIPSVLQEQFQGVRSNFLTSDLTFTSLNLSLDRFKGVIMMTNANLPLYFEMYTTASTLSETY